jgi:m7GpppX diphosphatase
MRYHAEQRLLAETPHIYEKPGMKQYIEQEITRPSKQWIVSVIRGEQEREEVKLQNEDYLLLPDTERVNRYWRIWSNTSRLTNRFMSPHWGHYGKTLNWLAIALEPGLRSLRDLRGRHIPMLKRMMSECLTAIQKETDIAPDEVMVYVHYPPSVYQLHIHFAYPYAQHNHKDTYRIHSVANIINNLEIDSEYYEKATLQMAVPKNSQLAKILSA